MSKKKCSRCGMYYDEHNEYEFRYDDKKFTFNGLNTILAYGRYDYLCDICTMNVLKEILVNPENGGEQNGYQEM